MFLALAQVAAEMRAAFRASEWFVEDEILAEGGEAAPLGWAENPYEVYFRRVPFCAIKSSMFLGCSLNAP
jgi:hypothetical protein